MTRALLTLAVLGALAAAFAFAPLHGRTLLDRWHAASGPVEFATRGFDEVKQAVGLRGAPPKRPAAAARTSTKRPGHPRETHTDEDRAALDRILAERAR